MTKKTNQGNQKEWNPKTEVGKTLKWAFSDDNWRNGYHNGGANKPTKTRTIIATAVTAILAFLMGYLMLIPLTVHCMFWHIGLTLLILVFGAISGNYGRCGFIIIIMATIALIVELSSSTAFRARDYSRILSVAEGSLEDVPSVEEAERIALMDTASARRLGDREIGVLADIVSQYDVSQHYTQINLGGHPMKVAPLVHSSFWKWSHNRYAGVPGYVRVDPVKNVAEYVRLEKPMLYVPSSFFGQDLSRHLYSLYPNVLFEKPHFEVDEDGAPWYIAPVYNYTIGIWGGKQITGAILCDPCTGNANLYPVEEIPSWVDFVYDGDLICMQYNWAYQLQNGFWNQWFGQRDCRKVTTGEGVDYGYLAIGDDIWIYTGITSVNGDSSNIGFLLSNQRTEETKFIMQSGANEFSAMAAAEGEVQEKGYTASFPALVRFGDEMAYLMTLKDAAGLVKMYAAVGVDQYNIVSATSVQNDTVARFRQMLSGDISTYSQAATPVEEATLIPESGKSEQAHAREAFFTYPESHETKSVTVINCDLVVIDGSTYVYMATESGEIYYALYTDVVEIVRRGSFPQSVAVETDGTYFLFA